MRVPEWRSIQHSQVMFGATTLIMAISARGFVAGCVHHVRAAKVNRRACSISIRKLAMSARIVPVCECFAKRDP